ncbi:MAG: HNH endonuclease signature motif containing protein [Candidatus Magasanikbacteria bacterium]|nr:HNH endonuclease signature motif containing protein [Candidatus Magasanikbacteria bacterium]
MGSKFLSALSEEAYLKLTDKLYGIQSGQCFICQKKIDLALQTTNIDHIIPLKTRGKDSEDNFALTHESCNKSKLDANLNIARILCHLKEIQDRVFVDSGRAASLKDVLASFGGSKYDFKHKISNDKIEFSFSDVRENDIQIKDIYEDILTGNQTGKIEKTCFTDVPIEYIYHDDAINPRGINTSISRLVKEFYKGNPQLHLCLARIDDNKLKIFDGQHKAVAQILLGNKRLLLRIFIDPNVDRLTETNTNAGSTLRQIAFDKSIMRQLNNTLYTEKIDKFQADHHLAEDDFSFSEQQLVDYFKGENVNMKKYISDSIKHSITYSKENKLKDYIDFEGKAKELPISYSAFSKAILEQVVDSKQFLDTPINYKSEEGLNPREMQINQIVELLNIIAEEIYIGKFKPEIGVYRIEQKIIDKKDVEITTEHLTAYRMSKEEIIFNWFIYLNKVIESYFNNTGRIYEANQLFMEKFDDQLWANIRNFINNLSILPLWKDKSMASTIFAGKKNYDYWKEIFEKGKSPDGAQVLATPLNFIEMIRSEKQ